MKWNDVINYAMILHCKTILSRGQPGLMIWIVWWIFVVNHAPGAGSIARPVDQQSSALPLCYGHPLYMCIENASWRYNDYIDAN